MSNTDKVCDACASGSPIMQGYVSWMNSMLDIIDSVPSIDAGAVNGQGINISRKRIESDKWATYSSTRPSITITQQAQGVKSDLIVLNKVYDRIVASANSLINKKSQWTTGLDPIIYSRIQGAAQGQVSTKGLLSGTGDWSTINSHEQLMISLLYIHQQITNYTLGNTGTSISWQGYRNNPVVTNKMIEYYACAQTIPACSSQTPLMEERGANVRGYWADIIRAGDQIKAVFTNEYWKMPKREGKIINFGDGFAQARGDTKDIGSNLWGLAKGVGQGADLTYQTFKSIRPGGGNRKIWAQAKQEKRQATREQKQSQKDMISLTQQTQAAIQQSQTTAKVQATQTKSVGSQETDYRAQDATLLQKLLNQSSDKIINNSIQMTTAIIAADSKSITYQIPSITKQIYQAKITVKDGANALYDECELHCSNGPSGQCGDRVI